MNRPPDKSVALIDGDIIAYRVGFACQEKDRETGEITAVDAEIAAARTRSFIFELLMELPEISDYEGFITEAAGKSNFRHKLAVTAPYKGTRKSDRPVHYDLIRNILLEEFEFTEVWNMEADDAVAIRATELGDRAVICSIDKDFLQVPCWHYNFVKKEMIHVNGLEGIHNLYGQALTGDRVDNIIGLRGVGPVNARKILSGSTSELECYTRVIDAYKEHAEPNAVERIHENLSLLYLLRTPNDCWLPPKEEENADERTKEG